MKKNIERLFILIFLLIGLMFTNNSITFATSGCYWSAEKSQKICPTTDAESCPGCTGTNIVSGYCNDICWMPPYNFGMRLTILTASGDEIDGRMTRDYMYTTQDFSSVRAISGKNSKIDYANGAVATTGMFQKGAFGEYKVASSIMRMPKFAYDSGGGTLADYFKELTADRAARILADMGYSLGAFEGAGDYLMVEPIGVVYYLGETYAGTVTELAYIFENFQVNGQVGGHNFLGFSRLTHHNLPWSVYLENDHFGKLTAATGTCGTDVESSQIIGGNGLGVGLYGTFGESDPYVCKSGCPRTIANPGTCTMTGIYEDPEDWCCIMQPGKDLEENLYVKEIKDYCPTYCREEVQTNFPALSSIVVKAGQHFTMNPVSSASADSYCKSEIDLDGWYADYTTANNNVRYKYNLMKAYEKLNPIAQKVNVSFLGTETEFSCSCPSGYSGARSGTSTASCGTCSYTNKRGKEFTASPIESNHTTYYIYGYSAGSVTVDNATASYAGSRQRTTSDSGSKNAALQDLANMKSTISAKTTAAPGEYEAAVTKRNKLETNIKNCQSINYEPNQVASMDMQYKYELVENDYRKLSLESVTTTTSEGNARSIAKKIMTKKIDAATKKADIKKYICSGGACEVSETTPYNYPRYNLIDRHYYTETVFNLKEDVYRYILKPTDISVYSKNDIPSSNLEKGSYYDIGYANFPVHPSLASGLYPYYIGYASVGTSGQFTTYMKEAPGNEDPNGQPAYLCYYQVKNEIIPQDVETGLNVIYRPIDLDNPFPSIDATGRIPGLNWRYGNLKYQETTNYNTKAVNYYITNNRGTTTYDVYNKTPMYEITLTPSLIKIINSYNKEQNVNDEGYSDFEMSCKDGRECKSNFLRTNLNGYISGCGIGDWNDCDMLDGYNRDGV